MTKSPVQSPTVTVSVDDAAQMSAVPKAQARRKAEPKAEVQPTRQFSKEAKSAVLALMAP